MRSTSKRASRSSRRAGVPHTYRAESAKARLVTMARVDSAARYDDSLRAVARPADSRAPTWATDEGNGLRDRGSGRHHGSLGSR